MGLQSGIVDKEATYQNRNLNGGDMNQMTKKMASIVLSVAGIAAMLYYGMCRTDCSNLSGTFLGIDLKIIGVAFMSVLIVMQMLPLAYKKQVRLLQTLMLSGALGGELVLLRFQIVHDTFCPFCLFFASCLVILYAFNVDGLRHRATHRYYALTSFLAGIVAFALLFEGTTGEMLYGMGCVPLWSFKNKALVSVHKRGAAARLQGLPLEANPYDDKRQSNGRITYARAFRRAWDEGWWKQDKNIIVDLSN
jgi:hypothetical protein